MATGKASGQVLVSGPLLEELLIDMRALIANLAGQLPDTSGRVRVYLDALTAGLTLGTITNVTTVATVTNLAQEGGQPANSNVSNLMNIAAAPLYNLITVS